MTTPELDVTSRFFLDLCETVTKAYFLPSSTEYLSTRQRGLLVYLLFKMPNYPPSSFDLLSSWAQFCRVQLRPLRAYRRYPHISAKLQGGDEADSAKLQDGDEASPQTDSNIESIKKIFDQIFSILEGVEPDNTLQKILSVQQSIEDIIGWHSTTHGQNRDPPPILIELLSNCFTFRELLVDDNQVNNDHEVAKDAFISKADFRIVHHILTEDLVDACHIIANNNGGPCHTYNLNAGGSGKNRSDQDRHDADNIFALAGFKDDKAGQPAVDAVWICLWCDKFRRCPDKMHDKKVTVTQAKGPKTDNVPVPKALLSEKLFLDSQLMRPFMDNLSGTCSLPKPMIIQAILEQVHDDSTKLPTPPKNDNQTERDKTERPNKPDVIIADWLFSIGKKKHDELKAIKHAQNRMKKDIENLQKIRQSF